MTEVMQGILAEAKKNRYSQIRDTLSDDDVAAVWENMSSFIEKAMSQQKGVIVQGFGTFTFTQKKLDIGNNKFIMMQRPVFTLSEKFAQTHGLQHPKYHVPGQIPVVQLNFASMSFESPFDRDTVENCVKEILGAVSRAVGARKNVELTFTGIGRLSIRDSKVKMRFYKEFINQMDGTGKLMTSMQNRPGTVDSVMSDRPASRPGTSATVILPKISSSNLAAGGLAPVAEETNEANPVDPALVGDTLDQPPPVHPLDAQALEPSYEDPEVTTPVQQETLLSMNEKHEVFEGRDVEDEQTATAIRNMEFSGESLEQPNTFDPIHAPVSDELEDKDQRKVSMPPSRTGSRMAMPLAKASGVSLLDDLIPSSYTPKSAPSPLGPINKSVPCPPREMMEGQIHPMKPPSPKLSPLSRAQSVDQIRMGQRNVPNPPMSACGHPTAGQELCYLCHQRSRRNIPVSFTDERKRRQEEEDRLLQQFQYMKDAEDTLGEQETLLAKRHDLQKMAAFNLGVSEAVLSKKKARDLDFHKSYIFQKRPLTPPKIFKQEEYSKDLAAQVESKSSTQKKYQTDEEFLERLEQVQLAEDLAAQREQFIMDKNEQQDMYKKALEVQIKIRSRFRKPDGLLRTPDCPTALLPRRQMTSEIRLPHLPSPPNHSFSTFKLPMIPNVLTPFSNSSKDRLNEDLPRLRFKPLQVPPREADNEVFGKNDMTNEKMAARRSRAYDMFRDQQDLVAQRKREAILKRLNDQKEEEDVLERTKRELREDRGTRFGNRYHIRKRLESDWQKAATAKKNNELEERLHALSPSLLVHEQCDKYKRCEQCKRKTVNCGESNIWSESRYIPGSRLMV
ncbi:coiled-coil domain-containing protein 81-like isoform X2 [Mizuhopecten yessoensis]|uniref:Coiled-coil domain-containing protein 81 n=1 Tax=Mizuhopecten yessoensis TaxID=6573 RepID=A0A210QQB8_MIZYE|nr:coiled-coil domain-containing protein 81-like isoform X2 [Mizuhopecten yessoensis]OWF50937.1 Coiled-coil domain-containing protein 81 [Mizuhopecten yessoensis]